MTASELLQLVQGGFTHDEIIQLCSPGTVPAAAPTPEPSPEPDNEPIEAPAPAPAPVPDPVPAAEPAQPSLDDLIKANQALQLQVAKLTSTMQANAIAQSMIPGGMPKAPDASDVLAQIIRPSRSKEV